VTQKTRKWFMHNWQRFLNFHNSNICIFFNTKVASYLYTQNIFSVSHYLNCDSFEKNCGKDFQRAENLNVHYVTYLNPIFGLPNYFTHWMNSFVQKAWIVIEEYIRSTVQLI
jgi:hypothetical protein